MLKYPASSQWKSPLFSRVLLSSLCMLGVNSTGFSADKPPATQNLAEVDADFAYIGEYMGFVSGTSQSPGRKYGLQIVSRGDGNFDVVLHAGGLPGDGGDPEQIQRTTAVLNENAVSTELGGYQISVSSNTARFLDESGNLLGTLPKYDRRSATLGLTPPQNALILFGGAENELWKNMKVTEDGLLQEGCETVDNFGDFHLHLEFRLPYKPLGEGQDRGNSGVYLQRRYEVQVLDSFGDPLAFNHCGAIYRVRTPDQNMSLPPLTWQTYDIDFRAARFDDEGNKTEDMKIRVLHNGVPIHDAVEIPTKTGAGKPEGPEPLTILLQDHGNPVRYQNIWMVKGDPYTASPEQPAYQYAEHSAPAHEEMILPHGYAPAGRVYGRLPVTGGDYWPYSWKFRMAPLGPPAPYYMHPPVDLPPYPYGY